MKMRKVARDLTLSKHTTPISATFSFVITSGNVEEVFEIESCGGQMTLGSEGVLDADNIAAYVIGLQVHDGGSPPLSSTAVVNVYVNSTNRPPVFRKINMNMVI